jgi:outer membrane protein assembly factor BamB
VLGGSGLGGVAANDSYVVIGDRDLDNLCDIFRCYDAVDGTPLWTIQYPAEGKLDYGNSPRATPLIHGDFVYLFGAFGDLHCVRLSQGEIVWFKNLRLEFAALQKLIWGTCSSPLMVEDQLIVNPGAETASIAALDPQTGNVLWQTPGDRAGYGSLIAATFQGVKQIVGHDRQSLGGWDALTGERLWKLAPPADGDFNVPTPIALGQRLLVTTENNGTRLFEFDPAGNIIPEPVVSTYELAPDISTPVVVNDRLYCVSRGLYCLDVRQGLQTLWRQSDPAFGDYAAVIGGNDRVLVIGTGGILVLVDATADNYQEVSRLRVLHDGDTDIYSHPALVGQRLFIRGESSLSCIDLAP